MVSELRLNEHTVRCKENDSLFDLSDSKVEVTILGFVIGCVFRLNSRWVFGRIANLYMIKSKSLQAKLYVPERSSILVVH